MCTSTNESLCGGGVCNDHSVLQIEQTIVNDRDASLPVVPAIVPESLLPIESSNLELLWWTKKI